MRLNRIGTFVTAMVCLVAACSPPAAAEPGESVSTGANSVRVKTWNARRIGSQENTPSIAAGAKTRIALKSPFTYVPKAEYETRLSAHRAEIDRVIQANKAAAAARDACLSFAFGRACNIGGFLDYPTDLTIRPAGNPAAPAAPAGPPAPIVTPEQAAYIATARLTLSAPKPMIGPSPDINPWKMAAVGYPMWLWAEGNLDPAPVADTVYDLSVSLDARLVKVVYDMGDGNKITCTDASQPWTTRVPAGAPSPVCGYTYQEPSLPKGDYTVTANAVWAVDWAINATTGTIPFYQSASTQLPVGELQVLNR